MFNVLINGNLLSTSGLSRAEARRRVAEFKANGVKAKVVPHVEAYPAEVIAEAKAALQSDDYVGFERAGEPTDDDARQFIQMTHTGVVPTPAITITEERIDGSPVLTAEEALAASVAIADAVDAFEPTLLDDRRESWPADLNDRVSVGSLQPGQPFCSLDGRPGTFIEMVGHDAKVSFEGKTTQWSGMSPVRLTAPIQVADKTIANSTTVVRKPGEVRKALFGHPPTRVVMWMGKNGYSPAQAAAVLAHYEIQSTTASIATFIRSGKKGDRGEVAPVTTEQADEIAAVVAAAAEVVTA